MPVDDSYTKALLHMNGADGATTFTDESGKTWTANGNAQIDTAQSKFGGASGLFDGTGDWIDTPDHADFDVGSGNFTIDFRVKRNANSAGTWIHVMTQADLNFLTSSISFSVAFFTDDTVAFRIFSGSTQYMAISIGTVTADSAWHHVACVRDGNTLRIFIDGSADGTADVTGITANNSASKVAIGRPGEYDGNHYFNGWIDELRFSKGIARWTANFTPPTREYGKQQQQMML